MVRRLYETIKINRDQKMKPKKLKKKKRNKFCYRNYRRAGKKREKEGRRYGWGKIKNKSGKRK
jgi:hypothetical protein